MMTAIESKGAYGGACAIETQACSSTIPHAARARLLNSKILVVDDFPLDLELTMEKLSPLAQECGCTIERTHDPLEALARIVSRMQQGAPFDLLVLDCCMQTIAKDGTRTGINGDELLKEVARAARREGACVPPVVYFSGSHAAGVQAYNYQQVEKMRRYNEEMAEHEADKVIGDIPITIVGKGESGYVLIDALSQVRRVSERTNQAAYREYLESNFRIATLESSFDLQQLGHMVRIAHIMTDNSAGFIARLRQEFAGAEALRPVAKLVEGLVHMIGAMREGYCFSGLIGDDFETRSRRHNMPSYLAMQRHLVQGCLEKLGGNDDVPGGRAAELALPVARFLETQDDLFHMFLLVRELRTAHSKTEINLAGLGKHLSDSCLFKPYISSFRWGEEDLIIEGPSQGILEEMLAQPIMNSVKFTETQGRRIEVMLDRRRVEVLPPAAREYFLGLSLSNDDQVAEILVKDNGCGIRPENLPRIFEAGFTTNGTGLGLALVAEQMPNFGGVCDVRSVPGEGTEFRMFFKLKQRRG